MRALVLELVLLSGVVFVVYRIARTGPREARRTAIEPDPSARWQLRHFGDGEFTVVAVSLFAPGGQVRDQHVVARIRADDPDWTRRFLEAKEIAEERAFHLNAGGTDGRPAE